MNGQIHRDGKQDGECQVLEERDEELVFNAEFCFGKMKKF